MGATQQMLVAPSGDIFHLTPTTLAVVNTNAGANCDALLSLGNCTDPAFGVFLWGRIGVNSAGNVGTPDATAGKFLASVPSKGNLPLWIRTIVTSGVTPGAGGSCSPGAGWVAMNAIPGSPYRSYLLLIRSAVGTDASAGTIEFSANAGSSVLATLNWSLSATRSS